MSTHDYIVDNQNGANFRSDLNNALAAIVSNNSSATAPTTTYAFMLWADTANDLLKQRNAADSAWISILTLSTGAPLGALAASLVSGTHTNFTSTGIDDNATSTAITIDASENVGIGETSPQGTLHVKTSDSGATAVAGADDLIIEHADYGGMSILSENEGHIYFGDNEDADVGRIEYNHSTNTMIFRTNGSDALTIKSDGRGLSQFTAKAWVNFADNGSINDSHNISSVSNTATGVYTVNFTNSMANTNYVTVSGGGSYDEHLIFAGRAVGSFPCYGRNKDMTSVDVNGLVAVFGD